MAGKTFPLTSTPVAPPSQVIESAAMKANTRHTNEDLVGEVGKQKGNRFAWPPRTSSPAPFKAARTGR